MYDTRALSSLHLIQSQEQQSSLWNHEAGSMLEFESRNEDRICKRAIRSSATQPNPMYNMACRVNIAVSMDPNNLLPPLIFLGE
jgi:hypothetical protein